MNVFNAYLSVLYHQQISEGALDLLDGDSAASEARVGYHPSQSPFQLTDVGTDPLTNEECYRGIEIDLLRLRLLH